MQGRARRLVGSACCSCGLLPACFPLPRLLLFTRSQPAAAIHRPRPRSCSKSESGALWLNADMLSPYQFYQNLFKTTDEGAGAWLHVGRQHLCLLQSTRSRPVSRVAQGAGCLLVEKAPTRPLPLQCGPSADVVKFLRMLTFLSLEEVAAIAASMQVGKRIPVCAATATAAAGTAAMPGGAGQRSRWTSAGRKPGLCSGGPVGVGGRMGRHSSTCTCADAPLSAPLRTLCTTCRALGTWPTPRSGG